jgi:DNA-binding NarL/FixJ family response regulator
MQSQVSAAAARANVALTVLGSAEALVAEAATAQPWLIVLDLSHPGLETAALAARLFEAVPSVTLVAFGPHVHVGRLEAARQAGCQMVVSRGEFHARMEQILKQYSG